MVAPDIQTAVRFRVVPVFHSSSLPRIQLLGFKPMMTLKIFSSARALLGNHSHAVSMALWFARRTGTVPEAAEGSQGTMVNTHTAPSSIALPNAARREPGGNGSGLGGRRQSRWLRIADGFAV